MTMRDLLSRASMTFAAGAFGGLINGLAIWAAGAYHLSARIGISIVPDLTPNWIYSRVVWGGLWGFVFLLPWPRARWWVRAMILSLAPSAFQLFYLFPNVMHHRAFGLGFGALTPAFVLAANFIWGIAAAWLLRMSGRA